MNDQFGGDWRPTSTLPPLAASFILFLFVASTTIFAVVQGWTPLPYADQWAASTPADIVRLVSQQHNEHRILSALPIFLADIALARGTNVINIATSILIQAALAALITWIVTRGSTTGGWRAAILTFALSFTLSAYQWENLLWGFQVIFVSVTLWAVAAFACIGLVPGRRGVIIGIVCSAAAAFSLASGVLVPVFTIPLAIFVRRSGKEIIALAIAAVAIIGLFLLGYRTGAHQTAHTTAQIVGVFQYFLVYFGVVFGYITQMMTDDRDVRNAVAAGFGFAGVAWALAIWIRLLLDWKDASKSHWVLAFILAFILTTGALTAFGRVTFGPQQAFDSRYGTPVLLFWLVLCIFPVSASMMLVRFALGACITIAIAAAQAPAVRWAINLTAPRKDVRLAMLARVPNKALYLYAWPDPATFQDKLNRLEASQLGPFSERWAAWFGKPLASQVTIVPPNRCLGSFDGNPKVKGETGAYNIFGWAWDPRENKIPDGIVATDAAGRVIGYAEITDRRADVPKAVPTVTADRVGWHGYLRADTAIQATAYALLDGKAAACPLPQPKTIEH